MIPMRLKDPDSTIDYTMDWGTKWLVSDYIVSSTWIVESGLTLVSQSNTTTTATVFISGGVIGNTYIITNRITTNLGRIDDRSINIRIETL